ncbi:hypothetical protein [Methylobacterium sp. Gmos1]
MTDQNVETISQQTVLEAEESARQYLLDHMHTIVRNIPGWRSLREETQERIIYQVDNLSGDVVRNIIQHLVTDGRKVIRTTIESLQVKDSLKVQLTAQKTTNNIADIGNAQGSWCYLITYDEKNNMDRQVPSPDPDQPELSAGELADADAHA